MRGAFKKKKKQDIRWFRTVEERPLRYWGRETIAVLIGGFDSCQNGTCTTMCDTLSEGKHDNNNSRHFLPLDGRSTKEVMLPFGL